MLTYSVIVGERTEQNRAIPIRLIFHFDTEQEAADINDIVSPADYTEYFGSKTPRNNYYMFRKSVTYILFKYGIETALPRYISTAKYAKGMSDILIADDRFTKTLEDLTYLTKNTSYVAASGSMFESSPNTFIERDGVLRSNISHHRIHEIVRTTREILMAGSTSEQILRNNDSAYVHIEIPSYDKDLIQNLISLLSISYGETFRIHFIEAVDRTIATLEKMVISKTRSRYKHASRAEVDIISGKFSRTYRQLVEYREKYIRCR